MEEQVKEGEVRKFEFKGHTNFPQPIVAGYGRVNSDGTKGAVFLPYNWTVVRAGVGYYRITHNISNNRYIVLISVVSGGPYRIYNIINKTDKQFEVQIASTAFAGSDNAFDFIVYATP